MNVDVSYTLEFVRLKHGQSVCCLRYCILQTEQQTNSYVTTEVVFMFLDEVETKSFIADRTVERSVHDSCLLSFYWYAQTAWLLCLEEVCLSLNT